MAAVVLGQSVASKACRAAAIARWTSLSSAMSTVATIVASDGLTTSLVAPDSGETHWPSMNRLGTGSSGDGAARKEDGRARWWRQRMSHSPGGSPDRPGGSVTRPTAASDTLGLPVTIEPH